MNKIGFIIVLKNHHNVNIIVIYYYANLPKKIKRQKNTATSFKKSRCWIRYNILYIIYSIAAAMGVRSK